MGEGETREDSHTCSKVQEVDTLGAAGQDDVELIAGPNLVDQCLGQERLQGSEEPLSHRLLQAGLSLGPGMRGRRLHFTYHFQGVCWWPTGLERETENRSVSCLWVPSKHLKQYV